MNEEKSSKLISWLKRKKRIIVGTGTILLILFMIFVVDFSSLINNIVKIGLLGMIFFLIAYTITFILRAIKLKLIFNGLNQNISFSVSYHSIGVSFIINELTPAKLGDFVKLGIIKEQENVKLSDSVCGIAIERILDVLLLFFISLFALIYLYFTINSYNGTETILGQNLQFFLLLGAIFLIFFFAFLAVLLNKTEFVIRIIRNISPKIADLLNSFLINFKEGIKKFKNQKKKLILISFLECLIWIVEIFIGIIFLSLLIKEGYQVIILILVLALVISYFSKIFPITPGGWGVSENMGALFIFLFYPEIPYTLILSIFIIEHLFRSGYLFFYGGYSMLHYNIKLKDLEHFRIDVSQPNQNL